MRSASESNNDAMRFWRSVDINSGRGLALANAECMTNRERQLRSIQRVKMKFAKAFRLQLVHLIDRHTGRNHLPRLGIVFQAGESLVQPFGNACAAALGEALQLREARDWQYTGHDG